ncbi:hypothetical protein [Hymenobacter psoromatis]|uniref:hypothetical protein n=1 Tax=Hymenobacter psoromatis TaxID=1484116 RepID=UPI001CC01943|nr:hypothetical protein [Hymenobacter psoromatis]
MAQHFTEGEGSNVVELSFPDSWVVVKYDQPGPYFYQRCIKPIGAGMTAVDFVAATGDNSRLWLIEVKDFRGYEVENRKRLISGSLGVEVMSNFLDTLAGLFAGIHGQQSELRGLEPAFRNPNLEVRATLLVATDPMPDQTNVKQLPPREQKRLAAELTWRGNLLRDFESRLKKPFRFHVHLFDYQQIAARFEWTAN